MHDYLRSVGFTNIKTIQDEDALVTRVVTNPTSRSMVEIDGVTIAEFRREFASFCGIAVRGIFDEKKNFQIQYFYPYFTGYLVNAVEEVEIEKHSNQTSFVGIIDDVRVGASLIFYLQNATPYLSKWKKYSSNIGRRKIKLTALSNRGTVLLPVLHPLIERSDEEQKEAANSGFRRTKLLAEAREGNEEAIEALTLDDMELYNSISKRIESEDILSIVESTFMPSGIESDTYYVIGQICDVKELVNSETNEKLYHLLIFCNEIGLNVCINEQDLIGEPRVGRRFRGSIWLLGEVEFAEKA